MALLAEHKRKALALEQFLKVVLRDEVEEIVKEKAEEFQAAKRRFKNATSAVNPFLRKKKTLQSKLASYKKERAISDKKRRARLEKSKKSEAKLDSFEKKLDDEQSNINAYQSQGSCPSDCERTVCSES